MPRDTKSMSVALPLKSTDPEPSEALLEEKATKATTQWAPGHQNIPKSSSLAALGLLVSLSGALFVLITCSGKTSIEDWFVLAPNVWLAISAIVSNALLRHIIFEGSMITWWQTAIGGNATIQALHQLWDANSLLPSLIGLLHIRTRFNRLSLATIAVVIASTHGAFYQGAIAPSSNKANLIPRPIELISINVTVAETLPEGWSGRTDGANSLSDIPFVSANLSKIVHAHVFSKAKFFTNAQLSTRHQQICGRDRKRRWQWGGMNSDFESNAGVTACLIFLRALGVQYSVVHNSTYDYRNANSSLDSADGSDYSTFPYLGFSIDIHDHRNKSSPLMTFDVKYKSKRGCESIGTHQIFTVTPAIVTYAIEITSFPSDPDMMAIYRVQSIREIYVNMREHFLREGELQRAENGKRMIEMLDFLKAEASDVSEDSPIDNFNEVSETFSGFTAAMRYLYLTRARFRPASNQESISLFNISGYSALPFPHSWALPLPDWQGIDVLSDPCDAQWLDPIVQISNSLDELMLQAALSVARTNPEKYKPIRVLAAEQRYLMRLEVNPTFAAIALLLPLLGLLFVLPTYWQYWILGRRVTTSPIEIAKAFEGQELLKEAGCNMDIRAILEVVGQKRVEYRVVPTSTDGDESGDSGQLAMCFYEVDGLEIRKGTGDRASVDGVQFDSRQ